MDAAGGQEQALNSDGAKRKMADVEIEIAKQKAQEIAARLVNTAELKRPRLGSPADAPSSIPAPQSSYPVFTPPTGLYGGLQGSSKRIYIPNSKVGVIIGRGGDMIKNLQLRSGAKIQITRDADADPGSLTRDVELQGTQEQISRAEELINEVIAESDAAGSGSGSSGNQVVNPALSGGEQFVMKVPNDKVALVIGKGGETIKNMQSSSGARIQVVPLRLPPGDTSTERSVYISGTNDQIEAAKALVNEVISGNRLKTYSGSAAYTQSSYPPAGGGWAPQGQYQQQPSYGYAQQGNYSAAPSSYYGSYPQQTASTGPTNSSAIPPPPPQQNYNYNMYGQPESQPAPLPPPPGGASYGYGYGHGQIPPTSAAPTYNYSQGGYSQQPPSYGQDPSSQAPPPPPPPPPTQPSYGQPDGNASAPVPAAPTSQPTYGAAPGVSPKPDGASTVQSQPPAAYGTGYSDGYGAYPSYGAPSQTPVYNQAGYGYGQQQGAPAAPHAPYNYYGQGGYVAQPQSTPPPPSQAGYYQGGYQAQPVPPQSTNGVSQPPSYGVEKTDDRNAATTDSGAAAQGGQ